MVRRFELVVAVLVVAALLAIPAYASSAPPSLQVSGSATFCCYHPQTTTLVVTNTGGKSSGPLTVAYTLDPALPGDGLAVTRDRCTGRSLGPNKSCAIDVTWTPGPDTQGTLTVTGGFASTSILLAGYSVP